MFYNLWLFWFIFVHDIWKLYADFLLVLSGKRSQLTLHISDFLIYFKRFVNPYYVSRDRGCQRHFCNIFCDVWQQRSRESIVPRYVILSPDCLICWVSCVTLLSRYLCWKIYLNVFCIETRFRHPQRRLHRRTSTRYPRRVSACLRTATRVRDRLCTRPRRWRREYRTVTTAESSAWTIGKKCTAILSMGMCMVSFI